MPPHTFPICATRQRCNTLQHTEKNFRAQQRKGKCVILATERKSYPRENTIFTASGHRIPLPLNFPDAGYSLFVYYPCG